MIRHFEDNYTGKSYLAFLGALYAARRGRRLSPVTNLEINGRPELKAFISWGDWVVECPYCRNALFVSSDLELQVFACPSPDKACDDGQWHRVALPNATDKLGIEAELMKRPIESNRNWHSSELVDDSPVKFLEIENHQHGIGVADGLVNA